MIALGEMQRTFAGGIRLSEPLSKYSVFGVGGEADYLLAPATRHDAARLLRYLHERDHPFVIVNAGSNMLVNDEGYRGLAVNIDFNMATIELAKDTVVAEAGARVAHVVDVCLQHSLAGAEMIAGISGTLGEWLTSGREIPEHFADVVRGIELIREGEQKLLKSEKRKSAVAQIDAGADTVLSVTLRLTTGSKPDLLRARREFLLKRNAIEPINVANAGRIFRDPEGATAASLIAEAGIKRRRVGGAEVFERYPNYIVADPRASSADILELIQTMRHAVQKSSGIELELDVRLVGFQKHTIAVAA